MITLLTEAIEIDLYEHLKRDPFRFNGQIRVGLPPPYNQNVFLPLCNTGQRYGRRIWFWCKGCNRRTSKLYIWSSYDYAKNYIVCRLCMHLKYASQYSPDTVSRREMNERKLGRLEKQKRRLWYNDKPTQFGRQYYKLKEEAVNIRQEISAEIIGFAL